MVLRIRPLPLFLRIRNQASRHSSGRIWVDNCFEYGVTVDMLTFPLGIIIRRAYGSRFETVGTLKYTMHPSA